MGLEWSGMAVAGLGVGSQMCIILVTAKVVWWSSTNKTVVALWHCPIHTNNKVYVCTCCVSCKISPAGLSHWQRYLKVTQ